MTRRWGTSKPGSSFACIGAAAAWFLHAHRLFEASGLTFGLTHKLFEAELLVSWAHFSKIGTRTIKDLLRPVGTVAAIYGLAVVVRERRWAEPLGIAAFLLYLVVVTPGNVAHNYYQLPVVPGATVQWLATLGVAIATTPEFVAYGATP